MTRPGKPLLVFDGDCGFCRSWIARWRRVTGDRVEYAPYQEAAARFPDIPPERFAEAVHLIESDGRRSRGAEAVFRSLSYAPRRGWILRLYRGVPGFAAASERCYGLVARHRGALSRLTRWLWGSHLVPPGETRTAALFLRALGAIYGVAFVSLWVQILGLAGSQGVLPARDFLGAVAERHGTARYWLVPTLCWIDAGDGALIALCAAGTALSLLLVAGLVPVPALLGLWATYLSLASVGGDFLWFQWDGLLLETGLAAIFLAPWRWRLGGSGQPPPSRAALWLLRWLLFRLMVSSAAVKLASGDPTWRDLTALAHHFETQPLPPWTAWFAHQAPAGVLRASTAAMFAIEGLVPLFVFAPRRLRFAAAGTIAAFQGAILATGNYGFFNWLVLALCLVLLDDGVWPGRRGRPIEEPGAPPRGRWPGWLVRPAAGTLALLALAPFAAALGWQPAWLGPVAAGHRFVSPLRSVNSYGLFAVMTTDRPEIVVEGSLDGLEWRPYEFRYKPGDVGRRPRFVAPHQPRLDWQMWFAALGGFRRTPWMHRFCERLLRGSPPVAGLLARNPFPDAPPRFVRTLVYHYRFTDPETRRATGAWWRREARGAYGPVLTLVGGRLTAVAGAGP